MQPTYDPLAIQSRSLDIEDYIDVVRRHRSWILGPILAGLVISVVVAFLWPDTYISSAKIRVLPPQVPEGLLAMPMNVDMSQRVNQMTQSILSRANLTNIINTYQLYPRERRRLPMEDIIEDMRTSAIKVDVVNGGGLNANKTMAFGVMFKYENRFTAQRVCADLVSKFIDENVRERTSSSTQMKDFVEDQWTSRKRELDAIEEQMAKFKSANVGRTPEQQGATFSAINGIESRMTNINAALGRVNQDRLIIENQISISKDQLRQITTPTSENITTIIPKNERLVTLERDVANFENRLQSLREQYQETHPDIKALVANLQLMRKERDRLQKAQDDLEAQAKKGTNVISGLRPETAREARMLEAQIQQLQGRIEASKMEEETYKKALVDADRAARQLQGTLATMPSSEKEYEQLRLQAMLARRDFEEIDRMRQRAGAAVELENRKQTEKLEILDQASLPLNPAEPKRWQIILGGAIGGLILGICLAGAREMKDSTLKNLKDVRAYTQLTILGCIPLLENDLVVRRRRRLAWLGWSTACLASIAIMVGSVIFYISSKS
ncbi:GumC family protein [Bryobacter aggregatus]|uniref:GumC family protein n=1 Tax=Bryobacter aggregatus TaxID=360054 RepID=UPI0004E1C78E|nr:Wzz/FepE/Etk N-terminal domain-containing protein [Bryobacter aggregatus]